MKKLHKELNIFFNEINLDALKEIPEVLERNINGGDQVIVKFDNGFQASIVNHSFSYGTELAVLDSNGDITYETPVTSDVEGWLDEEKLIDLLNQISALTKEGK